MPKLPSPVLTPEARSHLHINLSTIPAQKGKLLFNQGLQSCARRVHMGAERGDMLPAPFTPTGVSECSHYLI